MTAEEYLSNLIAAASAGVIVTPHELGILEKLMKEGKTGVYVP